MSRILRETVWKHINLWCNEGCVQVAPGKIMHTSLCRDMCDALKEDRLQEEAEERKRNG